MKTELAANGLNVIGEIPNDGLVVEACWEGSVPVRGEAFKAAGAVLDSLLGSVGNHGRASHQPVRNDRRR